MGGDSGVDMADLLEAVAVAGGVLTAAKVEFALCGGLAAYARGGTLMDHDVDFLIRAEQAEPALAAALTHYAPVPDTLVGEPLEIYPFLGSYLLGRAIDDNHVTLAVHGHAHRGTELGVTPGGVPVRNVAHPVIGQAYRVYPLGP